MNQRPKRPQPEPEYQFGSPILAPAELKHWLATATNHPNGSPKDLKVPCVIQVGGNPLAYVEAVWVEEGTPRPETERLYFRMDDTGMGLSFDSQVRYLAGGEKGKISVYLYGRVGKLLSRGPMELFSKPLAANEIDFTVRKVELRPAELTKEKGIWIEV